MRLLLTCLGASAVVALMVVGCGSDSENPIGAPGSSGSPGAGGSPASGGAHSGGAPNSGGATASGQCVGDYKALTQAQFDAAVSKTGSCISASDRKAVCGQDTTKVAEQCGGGCFVMGGDQDACVTTCINKNASPTLGSACVDCYVADVACARVNCLTSCGANPTSTECAACRVQAKCASDFFTCSGLPGGEPGAAGAAGAGPEPTAGAAGASPEATAGAGGTN